MTAIKSASHSGEIARQQSTSVPQHISNPSLPQTDRKQDVMAKCTNREEQQNLDSITMAKSRFADAVSDTVSFLMTKGGCSRERAKALVLDKLRNDDCAPDDVEVLDLVKRAGVGLNDAYTALTVAKAVRKACSERNLPAHDAIEELTNKLKTELMLIDEKFQMPRALVSIGLDGESPSSLTSNEMSKKKTPPVPLSQPQLAQHKNNVKSQSKDVKLIAHSCTTKSKKNGQKAASRKRAFTDEISSGNTIIPSIIKSSPNKDPVSMTIVEKGKLTADETGNKDPVVRTKSPVSNVRRSKRISSIDANNDLEKQQPPAKRSRT